VTGHEQLLARAADDGEPALDHPLERRLPGCGFARAHEGEGQQSVPGSVLGSHAHVHALLPSGEGGCVQTAGELWALALQRGPLELFVAARVDGGVVEDGIDGTRNAPGSETS